MAEIADFVRETSTTAGTGTLVLVAEEGYAEFSDAFSTGTSVYYCIQNGLNREVGIGTIGIGKTLDRVTPQVTLVAGVYDDSSPTAITLVGDSVIFISASSGFLNALAGKSIVTVTSTYTATSSDSTILCDGTSAGFTVSLPAAASNVGLSLNIKKINANGNVITIDGNGSETIDGSLTAQISVTNTCLRMQSDGSNWYIL